jgi:hypothetical protein
LPDDVTALLADSDVEEAESALPDAGAAGATDCDLRTVDAGPVDT